MLMQSQVVDQLQVSRPGVLLPRFWEDGQLVLPFWLTFWVIHSSPCGFVRLRPAGVTGQGTELLPKQHAKTLEFFV